MASSLEPYLHGLVHVMLFTLPGTPFIYYGDEIGLEDTQPLQFKAPWMKWNSSANGGFTSRASHQDAPYLNQTVQGQMSAPSLLSLLKKLSLMKIKERSLLYGDFESVYSERGVYVYSRIWDQSDRFLVLLNFGKDPDTVSLTDMNLPTEATVGLSSSNQRQEGEVSLAKIHLAGGEGLVLKFPFVA
ncbi:amino acid transporter heavy chain SLC3A2-like [Mustelus asterias]